MCQYNIRRLNATVIHLSCKVLDYSFESAARKIGLLGPAINTSLTLPHKVMSITCFTVECCIFSQC